MTLDLYRNTLARCSGGFGALLALVAVACVISGCVATRSANTAAAAATRASAADNGAIPPAEFADARAAQSLVQAIDERLTIMRDVAAAKWVAGAPILDAAREAVVLQQVAARAQALGLDPVTTQAFFAEQIRLARDVQQRRHDEWKLAGRCAR